MLDIQSTSCVNFKAFISTWKFCEAPILCSSLQVPPLWEEGIQLESISSIHRLLPAPWVPHHVFIEVFAWNFKHCESDRLRSPYSNLALHNQNELYISVSLWNMHSRKAKPTSLIVLAHLQPLHIDYLSRSIMNMDKLFQASVFFENIQVRNLVFSSFSLINVQYNSLCENEPVFYTDTHGYCNSNLSSCSLILIYQQYFFLCKLCGSIIL